ncbi:MAG: Hsp33 family molecular chaperone HslO, partial [Oscillospiraceae bacterium]|nr:Hsp33 family molecular chaperone HslO [Oscillospiraceae bacterium]
NVKSTGYVTKMLESGGATALLDGIMAGFSPKIIEQFEVAYKCTCSRERFLNAVLSLANSEIQEMKDEGEPIEVCCQFCEAKYVFQVDELEI